MFQSKKLVQQRNVAILKPNKNPIVHYKILRLHQKNIIYNMSNTINSPLNLKKIPIDLGGAFPICIEPARRNFPDVEWMRAMMDSYYETENFVCDNSAVFFVHGGCPTPQMIDCLQGQRFFLATRPDEISRETAKWLVERGCCGIELNVYTLQRSVLNRNSMDYNFEIVSDMVDFFRENHIEVGLHLVYGLPHSNHNHAILDVEMACQLPIDYLRLAPVLVLSGSELEIMFRAGRYTPVTLDDSIEWLLQCVSICEQHGIRISRMGWQDRNDFGVAAIAGPICSNLRGKVLSMRFLYRLMGAVAGYGGRDIVLSFHPKDEGYIRGENNQNIKFIQKKLRIATWHMERDDNFIRGEMNCRGLHD